MGEISPTPGRTLPHRLILQMGRDGFAKTLMEEVARLAGVDHCMVFAFRPTGDVHCLLDRGRIEDAIAHDLGLNYAGRFHDSDPNKDVIYRALQGGEQDEPIKLPFQAKRAYSDAYRRLFFEASSIVDKFAVAVWHHETCYYANFYRLADRGRFDAVELARLRASGSLLAATTAGHLASLQPDETQLQPCRRDPLSDLSERERTVCRSILAGYSSEAIAARLGICLNTVLTYRRRAYARLGICSQSQLFALVSDGRGAAPFC